MSEHLPVLLVVIPLLAAPLCVLLHHRVLVAWVASGATTSSAAIAAILLLKTHEAGSISYEIGDWPAAVGIVYTVDRTSALIALLISGIAAITVPLATAQTPHIVRRAHTHLFAAAFLLCIAGLLGLTVTGDAFNVFVFLEISSLSTYSLVSMGRHRRALTAALNYLMLGTIGGTFILIGIGLLYQVTGTLNMAAIAAAIPPNMQSRTLHVAFAFFTVGIGIKVALFPLHQWLPNAYSEAPSIVNAFLAGTATKVMYYLLLRFVFTVFGAALVFQTLRFGSLLAAISIIGMFVGALAAVFQTSLKRVLAYSSISQLGYLTLALSLGTKEGVTAGLLHSVAHGITKAALFIVVASIVAKLGNDKIVDGLGKRMPRASLLFLIGGLGLVGVPGTVGFVSKWYLLLATIREGHWVIAAAILVSSLVAVIYLWRLVEIFYLRPTSEKLENLGPFSSWRLIIAAAMMALTLYFGVFSADLVQFAEAAAEQLVGGAS